MDTGSDGGDDACWAHAVAGDGAAGRLVVEHDLDSLAGSGGAVWSLPHADDPAGELDANLVRLDPGGRVGEHRNDEVDVLLAVRAGTGELVVDGIRHQLLVSSVALVPRGARRGVVAGADGLDYLSIHRRRAGLTVATVGDRVSDDGSG